MRVLFLLLTTLLFARENPFVPVVTYKNKNIVKKTYFKSKKITLLNDARVLKSVIFKYQTLTGAIKEIEIPINQAIDWHNPITISTQFTKTPTKEIKVGFLKLYIKKHKLLLFNKDKLIRHFLLVKPFRYVLDFKANKDFLTYKKTTNTFIKKIILGNHSGFYRVVLYLDGVYKAMIKNTQEGYLIEFK